MDRNFDKFAKKIGAELVPTYYYKGKRIVSKKEASTILDVTTRSIDRYMTDWLAEIEEISSHKFRVFYYDDLIKGKKKVVEEKKLSKVKGRLSVHEKLSNLEELLTEETIDETAERIGKIVKSLEMIIKTQERTKELIPVANLDRALVEHISSIVVTYRRDRDRLPRLCANKDESEIAEILTTIFKSSIEDLQKVISQKTGFKDTLYELLEDINALLLKGETVAKIKSRLC